MNAAKIEIARISQAASRLVQRGWAQGSTGNITLLSEVPGVEGIKLIERVRLKVIFPELAGKVVWAKRSGSSMEQLAREPRRCLGLYSIGNDSLYLIEGEGPPTTEIYAHLMIYNETFHRAVVHCHWPRIELARERIDEGGLPQWIGTVGPLAPGSIELAEATGMEMRGRSVVVWERHGVVGAGPDIGKCLSSLEDAHKALFRSDLKAPHSSGGPVRPRRR